MQETSLHAELKNYYTHPGDLQEARVEGFFIDVLHGDTLIEIQTANFTALKAKLPLLLQNHQVKLVHPIAQKKWIVRIPTEGQPPTGRRKSPKRGKLEHVFSELVRIPHLIAHPNFTLEIVLTEEEEIRINDGQGSWRRKGWSIQDRRLISVISQTQFQNPQDFRIFLPDYLPETFTSKHLASALKIPRYLAQKAVYCLRTIELIEISGKKNRSYLYRIT